MHFDFLIEDISGKAALNILVPKIIDVSVHSYAVHSYRGVGHVPKNMKGTKNPGNRLLLNNLPKLLDGYGKKYAGYPAGFSAAVVLVCDLDDRREVEFRSELEEILENCVSPPTALFCFAIEEGEAWLLGSRDAVRTAYPRAKPAVLNSYVFDSICGTWEKLADAVYPGGSKALAAKGWFEVGREKSVWATAICPHIDVERSMSPSFRSFRDQLRQLAST